MTSIQSNRKDEHLFLAEKYFKEEASAGFDEVRLIHQPLPELALDEINVRPNVFDWEWPFFINAMTGGSPQTGRVNAQLAEIARDTGIAMALGSSSIAIKEPELEATFKSAREINNSGFLLANVSANQSVEAAKKAIEIIDANALQLHINSIQELAMPEGDTDLRFVDHIKEIVQSVQVPVIVKAVGAGMTKEAAALLQDLGVQCIDVGGRGGTSFAQIENARRKDFELSGLNALGQTTVESLLETSGFSGTRFATGGVRSPLDVVKALVLGADAVGIAGLTLHWLLQEGIEETKAHVRAWQEELPALFAALGVKNIAELKRTKALLSPALLSYKAQRELD